MAAAVLLTAAPVSPTAAAAPTEKSKHRTLGPRGLRKINTNIYQGGKIASNYLRRPLGGNLKENPVGGLAAFLTEEKKMKQEGYRLFPSSFQPPSYSSKKIFQFVGPSNYQGLLVTQYCTYYQLAVAGREVPVECVNPFKQGTPFGDKKPLPR